MNYEKMYLIVFIIFTAFAILGLLSVTGNTTKDLWKHKSNPMVELYEFNCDGVLFYTTDKEEGENKKCEYDGVLAKTMRELTPRNIPVYKFLCDQGYLYPPD